MIKNVALIGAGSISKVHIEGYRSAPGVQIAAICDLNESLAQARAQEYGIPKYCSDYHEILADPTIDAVSVVTPTFTHRNIVVDALNSGKHVLCEKPPVLTYQEALDCEEAAKRSGKVLMYGFVMRFHAPNQFLKEYIDNGKLGDIYYADVTRIEVCNGIGGWFRDKSKAGGGCLFDAGIHQLDLALYLMGYPKVKSVKGFTTDVNKDLPDRIRGLSRYVSANDSRAPRTVESFASALITFEGNKSLYIKASHIANSANSGSRFELIGDKGGVATVGDELKFLMLDDTNFFMESKPWIAKAKEPSFNPEIRHFISCCNGETECICTPHQGSELIKILNAIYESADSGKEVLF